jgi:hypothetical protein
MLTDALILAVLSSMGFVMTFQKLPRKMRRFLIKHAVFTDFLTFILTYWTLGSSLTALTAGAMVAIMTSAMCYIIENPNDFLYLYDFRDLVKEKLAWLKNELNAYGETYRKDKLGNTRPYVVSVLEEVDQEAS